MRNIVPAMKPINWAIRTSALIGWANITPSVFVVNYKRKLSTATTTERWRTTREPWPRSARAAESAASSTSATKLSSSTRSTAATCRYLLAPLFLIIWRNLTRRFPSRVEQRKHPHVIFEARTKVKQMCANTGMLEWGLRSGNYRKGQKPKSNERLKRDVREVTKYVETALVLDKAMVCMTIFFEFWLFGRWFSFFRSPVWEAERKPADRSRSGRHSDCQHRRFGKMLRSIRRFWTENDFSSSSSSFAANRKSISARSTPAFPSSTSRRGPARTRRRSTGRRTSTALCSILTTTFRANSTKSTRTPLNSCRNFLFHFLLFFSFLSVHYTRGKDELYNLAIDCWAIKKQNGWARGRCLGDFDVISFVSTPTGAKVSPADQAWPLPTRCAPPNRWVSASTSTRTSLTWWPERWRTWSGTTSAWATMTAVSLFIFANFAFQMKDISLFKGDECHCGDWHGCIMSQSIMGLDNVQPYKFSECSLSDYIDSLRIGHGICLFNRPNQVTGPLRMKYGACVAVRPSLFMDIGDESAHAPTAKLMRNLRRCAILLLLLLLPRWFRSTFYFGEGWNVL